MGSMSEARNRAQRYWLSVWALAALAAFWQPVFAQQAPAAPAAPPARFVVVLDAAHGGDDSGGRLASNQLEKTFTLALSGRLRSLLGARGIQVVMTRESDAAVDPVKRAEIANHAQAQACIVLHATRERVGRASVCLFADAGSARALCRLEDGAGGLGDALAGA